MLRLREPGFGLAFEDGSDKERAPRRVNSPGGCRERFPGSEEVTDVEREAGLDHVVEEEPVGARDRGSNPLCERSWGLRELA